MALKPLWLAGILITLAGLMNYLTSPASSSAEVLAQARQIAELHQTLNKLQAHNQQLERELQSLQRQLPLNPPAPLTPTDTKPLSQPTDKPADAAATATLALLQEERLRHKNVEYDTWLRGALQNGTNPAALMGTRFEQEAVDDRWAPQQEQRILDLFSRNDELRGIAVKSAKCRTTQCEISLAANTQEQSFQLFEKASKAFQSQSPGNFMTFATNMETNTATLYLSTEASEANR